MKPLARVADPTSHLLLSGLVTVPGAPLVPAHGLPADRVLDPIACGVPGDPPGSIQTHFLPLMAKVLGIFLRMLT